MWQSAISHFRPSLTFSMSPNHLDKRTYQPRTRTHFARLSSFLLKMGGLVDMRNKKICLMMALHWHWCNIKFLIAMITKLDRIWNKWTRTEPKYCWNLNNSSGYSMGIQWRSGKDKKMIKFATTADDHRPLLAMELESTTNNQWEMRLSIRYTAAAATHQFPAATSKSSIMRCG